MARPLGVGIIGCGNISTTYLSLAPLFRDVEVRACADKDRSAAERRGAEFGIAALSVRELLASDEIDIVVNLTVPAAHAQISKQILAAGKHVYSEKPLVLSLAEGREIAALAKRKRLKVASAPDTFLGGAHQRARRAIDQGAIGRIASGTAHFLSPGMESWHPNPDFFFKPGGGPVLDMGPYYIANLIQLLGPVRRVAALAGMARKTRIITSEPRRGQKIAVRTPTTIHGLLEFVSGAQVTLSMSWDVHAHRHQHTELYGTDGALFLPDPNFFGGEVLIAGRDGAVGPLDGWPHPLGFANQETPRGRQANYRGAGLADLARAIRERREPRCSLERALHAIEIMLALLGSGETGRFVTLKTRCTRPPILGVEEAQAMLK
jgi:predicted dehydrogenase